MVRTYVQKNEAIRVKESHSSEVLTKDEVSQEHHDLHNPEDRWVFHLDGQSLSWSLTKDARIFFPLKDIMIAIRGTNDRTLIPAIGYETENIPPLIRHGVFDWKELSLMRNALLKISLTNEIANDVNDLLMIFPTSFPVSINMRDVNLNWGVYQRVKNALDIIHDMRKYKRIGTSNIKIHINLLDRELLKMSKDDVDTWGNLIFIRCYPEHRLADIINAIRILGRDDAVKVINEYIRSLDIYTTNIQVDT